MILRALSLILLLTAVPAAAQAPLPLDEAIARARARNLDARAAVSAEREAAERVVQARAGYLPRVDFSESWQRGNQPVFVFSSLLAQRDFAASNFEIDALNRPDPIGNLRAALTVEQTLFDAGTRAGVRAARLGHELASTARTRVGQDLAVAVTDAYGRALVAAASKKAAAAAVEAAAADRERARNRRDAGMVTDADVLQFDVHLARARERQIRATSDEAIARARLNQLMGEPLDAVFEFVLSPSPAAMAAGELAALEEGALAGRAEVAQARLEEQLASSSRDAARAAFLPQVAVQAGWEANGRVWNDRASSWVVGAVARVNLFRGFADRARLAETREAVTRKAVEREKAETSARLDVRIALARLDAARATDEVGRAAAGQARASRRIIRDRYEAGMADTTALLRAAEAVEQAETAEIAARVDVLLAAAALDRALGK